MTAGRWAVTRRFTLALVVLLASLLSATARPAMAAGVSVSDAFTGDGTVDPAYAVLGGGFSREAGRLRATATTENYIVRDAGIADATVTWTLVTGADSGPIFRVADANNYWLWSCVGAALYRKAGSFIRVADAPACTAGDKVSVKAAGNVFTLSRNGTVVLTYTVGDGTQGGGTKFGLRIFDSAARWDDFSLVSADYVAPDTTAPPPTTSTSSACGGTADTACYVRVVNPPAPPPTPCGAAASPCVSTLAPDGWQAVAAGAGAGVLLLAAQLVLGLRR